VTEPLLLVGGPVVGFGPSALLGGGLVVPVALLQVVAGLEEVGSLVVTVRGPLVSGGGARVGVTSAPAV
jgi:hypothetical protein